MAAKKRRKRKKYQLEFSLTSGFFWGIGFCLLLAWIFVLGILVGRGFLLDSVGDISEIKTPLNRFNRMIGKNEPSEADLFNKSKPDPKFAFYDELSTKKEEALKNSHPEEKKENEKPMPPKKANTPKNSNAVTPKNAESQRKTPIDKDPKESQKKEKIEKNPPGNNGKYTLQLASLEDELAAMKMANRLISKGHPAYFYETQIKGKTYFRVRCGRYRNKNAADKYRLLLKKQEGISGFVTLTE